MNMERVERANAEPEPRFFEGEITRPVALRARTALLALMGKDAKKFAELYSLVGTMKDLLMAKGINPINAAAFHELVGSTGYEGFAKSDDIQDPELNVANFLDHWNAGDAAEWLADVVTRRTEAPEVSGNRAA